MNVNEGFFLNNFLFFLAGRNCRVELLKHFNKIKKNSPAAYFVNVFYISDRLSLNVTSFFVYFQLLIFILDN